MTIKKGTVLTIKSKEELLKQPSVRDCVLYLYNNKDGVHMPRPMLNYKSIATTEDLNSNKKWYFYSGGFYWHDWMFDLSNIKDLNASAFLKTE